MNIYLPGEGGENVELSPFAITAEIYRDSAPASEASSSSSRRSSASDTTVASYKTADDHPGDPPNYSVLEPLLTPEEPHPIRPSLHRFQFCLPDPPKTYWTPTPGGPLRTCSLEDLEAGKKGKEMLKQIIEVGRTGTPSAGRSGADMALHSCRSLRMLARLRPTTGSQGSYMRRFHPRRALRHFVLLHDHPPRRARRGRRSLARSRPERQGAPVETPAAQVFCQAGGTFG